MKIVFFVCHNNSWTSKTLLQCKNNSYNHRSALWGETYDHWIMKWCTVPSPQILDPRGLSYSALIEKKMYDQSLSSDHVVRALVVKLIIYFMWKNVCVYVYKAWAIALAHWLGLKGKRIRNLGLRISEKKIYGLLF